MTTVPPKMKYVSLHSHSTFSYGDGYGPVRDHVARVAELGGTALALTEHGNTSSHVQLEKACREFGIKPIFGLEAYTAPPKSKRKWHQTILAMNEVGLQNLNRIVSRSWAEGFYQWPTVSSSMLEDHSEGLIVTSGCADSLLSCTLLGGKSNGIKRLEYTDEHYEQAIRVISWYQKVFGDRYYLEVQRFPGLERTCVLNPAFERLSQDTGARLVATADVHYPLPTDNKMQTILHAAHRGGTVETTEANWEYDILLTYPTSDQEITRDLIKTGLSKKAARSAVAETARIANRCLVELPKSEPIKFPYDKTQFDSIEDYVWELLREGWEFRYPRNRHMQERKGEYTERVKYEMARIIPRGFCDYFAMLADAVQFAKDSKIPVGPARGSAAASLVCYLLRITEVDPLQHPHMLFERFIDPKRLDLPDVDLDFDGEQRPKIRAHLVRRYGADHVGNIGNFTRYKGKNSIDDVARVYNIPEWETKIIKDRIIERSGGDSRVNDSLADTFEAFPATRAVLEKYPQLDFAQRLEGNYRGLGVHAAGIVVSNAPITETCAFYTREVNGHNISVVAYDKKDADYLGMLKADFLGLSTMTAIGHALREIDMDLEDLYAIPLDEPKTIAAFTRNDVVGVFQFEGRATRLVCGAVRPEHFGHLADINALSRPGPLFSGMTAEYARVRHGEKEAEHLHPLVDKVTEWTYGQIVYQEQVLRIIAEVGGFSVQRVGDIRKIISQKLGEASFQKMWEEFRDGAKRIHGIPEPQALKIWRFMVTSATYSFNIAHCVSYSMLAFWQMWLKQHHPEAFYAAALTRVGDGKEAKTKRNRIMRDAVNHGVRIAPPDLLISGSGWTGDPQNKRVVAGFEQIDGIGPASSAAIIDSMAGKVCPYCLHDIHDMYCGVVYPWGDGERECKCVKHPVTNGFKLEDWSDLKNIKGIGDKTIARIEAFCESPDPFDLIRIPRVMKKWRRRLKAGGEDWIGIPRPTHTSDTIPQNGEHKVVWMGILRKRQYKDYIEDERARSGKSVDEIRAEMKDPDLVKSCTLECYDDGEEEVYLRFSRWRFPKYERLLEELVEDEYMVIVVGKKRDNFGLSVQVWEFYAWPIS